MKTHDECDQHHSVAWGQTECKEGKQSTIVDLSLLPDCRQQCEQLPHTAATTPSLPGQAVALKL